MTASVRSSPLAALGVLVACLAISSLGRHAGDDGMPARPVATPVHAARPTRVDLNTASATELEALPRIGPALAARIVAHRAAHGGFTTVDDLDDVPGIGPAILALVRAHVTVSGPARDAPALLGDEPPR